MDSEINDGIGGHEVKDGAKECQHGKPVHTGQKRCFCAQDAKLKAIHDLGEFYGTLEIYHETGMEGLAFTLHDDRGIFKAPSFNNATKKYDGPEQEFHSIEWTIWLDKKGQEIEVYKEDGTVEYRGPLTQDKVAMAKRNYNYSFVPKEIAWDVWCSWFNRKAKARAWKKNF